MPNKTGIHWTDFSSNPIKHRRTKDGKKGWWCIKASPGCMNCYSETLNMRLGNKSPYRYDQKSNIKAHIIHKELKAWHSPKYVGKKIFVGSMTDLFEPLVTPRFLRAYVWVEMMKLPKVTFQILTKRPERLNEWEIYLARAKVESGAYPWYTQEMSDAAPSTTPIWPDNVWVGTSIESRKYLHRIDELVNGCQSKVKFISFEPLLEDIGKVDLTGVDWVIVGGESGAKHRPFDPQWALNIRDQCEEQGVAFFYKQGAALKPGSDRVLDSTIYEEFPAG